MRLRLVVLLLLGLMLAAACRSEGARPAAARLTATPSATTAVQVLPQSTGTSTATPAPASVAPPTASPAPLAPGTRQAPFDPLRAPAPPRAPGDTTPIVVLDPGHGADEIGAAANGLVEKDSNLDMAFRVEALLQRQGVRVFLTRLTDDRAYAGPTVQGYSATRRDLQARVDLANQVGADLFVSLHSNGSASSADRGVETYWDSGRPFAAQNQALATAIQSSVVGQMAAAGTATIDRGTKDDACLRLFQGRCYPLFVLGPQRTTSRDEVINRGGTPDSLGFTPSQAATAGRATMMPGALVELLFISSPADAQWLSAGQVRDTLAQGVAQGILAYLRQSGR